ncbi:conserved hypothetical protein [Talaromyces stipitatus ATCC 10500]|uniref:BZIP transcription factor FlbB n=1 Tax=Talaromyces stipitatus (strain ATCC 10500 / CBS 375.48 / QM 6759 / NRRL 1006) TaxID=441959 RepID=B8MQC2_TALSN|nr:uncharacterized protein TSTA_058130 [Talaromyces stipitatus ATCC 10500]EED13324.1 conserved hypothetical protein [Talaromyces stipitatus ATCC 10500]
MSSYPSGNQAAGMGIGYNDQFARQYEAPAPEQTKFNGFLKALGAGTKKTKGDGQPPKRRGPKPDSKPALTRRQELNRQAQRTHRERKEQYIRSLESELSRLREVYSVDINAANQKIKQQQEMVQSLRTENNRLMGILKECGIPVQPQVEIETQETMNAQLGATSYTVGTSSVASQSAGFQSQPGFLTTPPSTFSSPHSAGGDGDDRAGSRSGTGGGAMPMIGTSFQTGMNLGDLDYSASSEKDQAIPAVPGIFDEDPQLGIDFILQLESPCRDHTEYLCREASKDVERDRFFSGHALMASCPPPNHIENVPEGNLYPHQTYELPLPNLEKLLNLSKQLITDGQVTPIMILQSLKNHDQYRHLTKDDVKAIVDTLTAKIRCYGFGAVIEDFELRDCLQNVLGTKLYHGRSPPSKVGDDALYR